MEKLDTKQTQRPLRVATAQLRTGKDTERVLQEIIQLIAEAARGGAALVHFQECCNYPTSYDSRAHAWKEALTVPGHFFETISAAAREHSIYVSFNAAVKGLFPSAYMVNHLVGPDGALIGGNKKQVLMWIEREAFVPSDSESQVFVTPIGRIGSLSCMDGLVPETARVLACKGADIILNSLCSNGIDEAHTHIPARAAENGVFVISANRIGDMVSGTDLERLIHQSGMDRETLRGAGESQIVGPDGDVIARATKEDFGLTYADIDLSRVARARRMAGRRPEAYGPLITPNEALPAQLAGRPAAQSVKVSIIMPVPLAGFEATLSASISEIRKVPAGLVVLPELFAWVPGRPPHTGITEENIARATERLSFIAGELGTHVVAGIPGLGAEGPVNQAVLFGPGGVLGIYQQVHVDPALQWSPVGTEFPVFDLPFGRIGMLLGEDLFYPEAARVLARKGVDLIACPSTWREEWQVRLMLTERSAENHVCIVAAARRDSPCRLPSLIVATPTTSRFAETGEVNMPDRWIADPDSASLTAEIDLRHSRDKRLMGSTDVIMDTQPALYTALIARREQ